jgi:hypothetical protein
MKVNLVLTSGVVQVGDVGHVRTFARTSSSGGPRGAASFITQARHIHSATRLHFADQEDSQTVDSNIVGDVPNP